MRKICHRRDLLSGATAGFGLLSLWGLSSVPAKAQLATPPDITTYARTPAVTDIAVSPTGTKVAWVTSREDDLFLNVMTIGQEGIKSLAIGKIKVWQILWLDEISLVVATSETVEFFEGRVGDKYEYFRARILNTETGKTSLMAAKEGGLKENIKGSIQRIKTPQGYRVTGAFYEIAAQDHSLNSRIKAENAWCLYSFAPGEKQGVRLVKGNNLPTHWVLTPTGYIVACSEFDDHTKSWILSFNRNDADKPPRFETVLTVKVAGDVPGILGLGQTDGTVLVVLPDENGGNWVEVDKDGTVSQPIDPDGPKFSRTPLFHPTTLRYAGVVYEDDWYTYKLTNPLLNKLTEAAGQIVDEGTRVELIAFAEDPRKMVVYTEAKDDPGSYNFVDFTTGDITFVAAKYPGFPTEWLQEKTPIKYKATDGLEIPAYLTLPPFSGDKNLPLIVLPHGGPRARDNIRFDWQVQLLASRGYAVLQPNFRGSDGYTVEFYRKGFREWGRKMQTDLSDGVRHLVSQGIVDPKRVSILGASYGGYAALAGATIDTGVYNCAVSIAGISDVRRMINSDAEYSAEGRSSQMVLQTRRYLGEAGDYDEISPAQQAKNATIPILLLHGKDDSVVPFEQSEFMASALKNAGKTYEFVALDGQDHWETKESGRIEMMTRALSFLEKYNPPKP